MSLNRRSQEVLQRMEARLQALEVGIARHEARAVELRQIKDRIQTEREEWLAKLAAPAPAASVKPPADEPSAVEPPAAEVKAPERESGGRTERPAIKSGPPPQAAAVTETGGEAPEQLWARFWGSRNDRKPEVIYPWPPAGEPSAKALE